MTADDLELQRLRIALLDQVLDEPEAWRRATPGQRIGALRRELDRTSLVRRARFELEVGDIDAGQYVERCVQAAREVFGDE